MTDAWRRAGGAKSPKPQNSTQKPPETPEPSHFVIECSIFVNLASNANSWLVLVVVLSVVLLVGWRRERRGWRWLSGGVGAAVVLSNMYLELVIAGVLFLFQQAPASGSCLCVCLVLHVFVLLFLVLSCCYCCCCCVCHRRQSLLSLLLHRVSQSLSRSLTPSLTLSDSLRNLSLLCPSWTSNPLASRPSPKTR